MQLEVESVSDRLYRTAMGSSQLTSATGEDITRRGILCVVSGPSGSGKTTLCHAMRDIENCYYTVSCTTRAPRGDEEDGVDYHFLSEEEFAARIEADDFLEHAEVFSRRYGTLKSEVIPIIDAGRDVVMDLDVQGAAQIRECEDPAIRSSQIDVFILVPMTELRNRLADRATETEEQLAKRLAEAKIECASWDLYQYAITSTDKENDRAAMRAIITAERRRTSRLTIRDAYFR
ncbi:MAG: guanylate kinase [Verrucomicrobiales bacterium]|jgi:guanylate kinase